MLEDVDCCVMLRKKNKKTNDLCVNKEYTKMKIINPDKSTVEDSLFYSVSIFKSNNV